VRSIKHECLNCAIPFGKRHLRRTITEYVEHYHQERNHQGLENELVEAAPAVDPVGRFAGVSGSADFSIITVAPREQTPGGFDASAQRWDIPGSMIESCPVAS
jgi:hypothetical protein